MAIFSGGFWLGFVVGGGAIGAVVWYYKSKIQAAAVSAATIAAKAQATASAVVSDIKKI